jgi:hypothetical protein
MWQVAVGDSGGYQPVFGGPVVLDVGRCNQCNINLERVDGGPRPARFGTGAITTVVRGERASWA